MAACIQIDHLTKSFGAHVLFEDLSLTVETGARIGIIARNGAGKSTLMNIIAGREDYEAGTVYVERGLRFEYLAQTPVYPPGTTVLEACFTGDTPVIRAMKRYEEALENGRRLEAGGITGGPAMKAQMLQLQEAMAGMDVLDAWNYETRARQILTELQLPGFDLPVERLSGGQLKRVALAHALISEPEILMLDEPTNHLDLEVTAWLEKYLSSHNLTLLMVTHDRWFLDRVCTVIFEVDDHTVYTYKGNYSKYLQGREERRALAEAQRMSDANLYRRELEWMRRQPQARATKAQARIDAFYDLEERLQHRRDDAALQLQQQNRYIGRKIFEMKHVCKAYGGKTLLTDFAYNFARREKLGIVGANGAGKTTLLKMLVGEVQPDSGTVEVGETVRFGYYTQQGIVFDDQTRVIDVVTEIADNVDWGGKAHLSASQLLQRFLFPPAVQHDFVGKLSGGERRRLYLCTVLMRNPNFLILDEPTNDLDILTLEVLEEYLRQFDGCVIVVSHDRCFLNNVADHLIVLEGGGAWRCFPSDYSDYLLWKEQHERQLREQEEARKPAPVREQRPARPAEKRKRTWKEQKEMEQLEANLMEWEEEKKGLEEKLSSGILPSDGIMEASVRIGDLIRQIDDASMRWLELSEIG